MLLDSFYTHNNARYFKIYLIPIEKNEDKVDNTLEVEKQNLIYLKKSLEAILKPIQEQLYVRMASQILFFEH